MICYIADVLVETQLPLVQGVRTKKTKIVKFSIIMGSVLQVIKVWDVETGRSVFEFSQAHGDHAVTCMSFDSTERRYAVFSLNSAFFVIILCNDIRHILRSILARFSLFDIMHY